MILYDERYVPFHFLTQTGPDFKKNDELEHSCPGDFCNEMIESGRNMQPIPKDPDREERISMEFTQRNQTEIARVLRNQDYGGAEWTRF